MYMYVTQAQGDNEFINGTNSLGQWLIEFGLDVAVNSGRDYAKLVG